jgi:hypothetical protein
MATIKITPESITERLDVLFKAEGGKSKTCEKHEKRMKRITPQQVETLGDPWVLSISEECVTLVARSTCGHSKEPCFSRFAADLAVKDDNGEWISTTKDYRQTHASEEEIAAVAAAPVAKAA